MEIILLKETEVIDYIQSKIKSIKEETDQKPNHKYHHTSKYKNITSILKKGIISIDKLNTEGYINLNEEQLSLLTDISSHINGLEGISLSVVDDKKTDPKKLLYDPYNPEEVDILISPSVKARRSSKHYDNEYIANQYISTSELTAIDIRILKYLKTSITKNKEQSLKDVSRNYNKIIDIANTLLIEELNIPLREMSEEISYNINLKKAVTLSKIKILEHK